MAAGSITFLYTVERHISASLYVHSGQHSRKPQVAQLEVRNRRHNLLVGDAVAQLLNLGCQLGKLTGVGGIVTYHVFHQRNQFFLRRMLAGSLTAAADTFTVAMVVGVTFAVEMVVVMGVNMVVGMGMGMLMGVGVTVMGMLMGMSMAVLMVMSAAKVVMMDMHINRSFGFSYIIILFCSNVKTFLYPHGGACEKSRDVVSFSQTFIGGRIMSQQHDHAYLHAHGIAHGHVHENQKAVINRLSRAIGHLEKVKRMVEEGEDCSEVLIQLAAVRSALENTGKVILKDHMRHCVVDAVTAGDESAIEDLCQAIDKFMK